MEVNYWKLLAGLGIFLFGIYLLEEAIKLLSGKALKRFIRNYTSNPIKAISTGALSTAVLQSSSAVTLIVIAFVGAGVMQMQNAISVIVGSNLGTTITSWIVATAGFKFNIESLSLPLIAIGGLGLIFSGKSSKYTNFTKLLVGFGFLFMGLDYMKNSVLDLVDNFPLDYLRDQNLFIYVFAGIAITGLVQSSSAAVALTLSLLHSNMIGFEDACYIVIGSNIGTTVTVLIGTLGAQSTMKKVAYSHFFFNVFTGIISTAALPGIVLLMDIFFDHHHDPVFGVAIFHTIFNLLGVLLFLPFIRPFTSFINYLIKDKTVTNTHYIHKALPQFPEESIMAFRNEVNYLLHLTMAHNLDLLKIDRSLIFVNDKDLPYHKEILTDHPHIIYPKIKSLQAEIFNYGAQLQQSELSNEDAQRINHILHAVRYAVASAKSLKDISKEIDELSSTDDAHLDTIYQNLRQRLHNFCSQLIEVLNEEDETKITPALLYWNQKIRANDTDLVNSMIKNIANYQFTENKINVVISAQRAFGLSTRQFLLAVKDFSLSETQTNIFDNFDNYER
jgi:phosphate:Na+ symporter